MPEGGVQNNMCFYIYAYFGLSSVSRGYYEHFESFRMILL
jgi:hypothetical protein